MAGDLREINEMLDTAMKAANKAEDAVGAKAIILALKAVVLLLADIKVEIRNLSLLRIETVGPLTLLPNLNSLPLLRIIK